MRQEREAVDISASPELRHLAEEVRRTERPRELRRVGEVVPMIVPFSAMERSRRPAEGELTARDIADFESALGSWCRVDGDQLLADIYAARNVANKRPVVGL